MKKKIIINIVITLLIAIASFYIYLPPLNITAPEFWVFAISMYCIYLLLNFLSFVGFVSNHGKITTLKLSKSFKIMILAVPFLVALIFIINFVLSPIFNSKNYASRISIRKEGNFIEEIKPVDFSHVPLLDKDSTSKIGDRVMGEMTDLVSQFYVSNMYTQINYNNKIVRVTPLEYDGIIKYFTNRKNGVAGYIIVNSTTGDANLVRLEKGMKYMPSALFNERLERKLRFSYPTEIFGKENFEIDNDGNPYWVVPTIKYTGIGLKEEITGVVILDPITGNSKKYEVGEIPSWIDHVYSADLIIEQFNDWGLYNEGFINSIFGQKNVVATTEGYNYIAQDDDIYLYTGVTSVSSDESNLGFILTNMRTKETNYYLIPGAEEYSAMASAEGAVQQMNYKSTFPLLINLNNRPTYLISLKDNAGLVKMYAFIDVQNYQKVVVTESNLGIIKAKDNYLLNLDNNIESEYLEKEITIKKIEKASIDGNTYYYIIDYDNEKYRAIIKINEEILPFMSVSDKIKIKYKKVNSLNEIVEITL